MKNLVLILTCCAVMMACSQEKRPAGEKDKACATDCVLQEALPPFNNATFYTDGKFNEEAAKNAILQLMSFYHYPVTAGTRSQLWVSDYGTGRFTELGLAAIMYVNNVQDRYMLQDLFLLPNQMLPEHWHEKPDNDLPAKMEGWLVRNGMSYIVGEGDDNLASFPDIRIPACHEGGVTVRNAVKTLPGEFVPLARVYSHHWQFAGPQGAILTEVANVHANDAVRHQVKAINDYFLGK